ncbi:MAG TPA: hypothetical protein VF595_10245 [Tepidisphaeraceae bacterium]
MAAVLSTATLTLAQATAPAPQTSSPYWNGNSAPLADLPATEIRTVPVANANRVRSHWTFQQTMTDLNNAVRLMRTGMDRQPEYVKALADEKTAYDAMERARDAALADLQNNPAYTGAETLRRNVSAQIADEMDTPKPDPTRLAGMAKLKLQYVKDNRKLEVSALERDQAYQDARRRHLDAAARVSEMRSTQAFAVASDQSLAALRKQVADARIERLTANAFYESALQARNIAVDYALLYRGVDRYHGYGNGYAGYGYGVGPYGLVGGSGRY